MEITISGDVGLPLIRTMAVRIMKHQCLQHISVSAILGMESSIMFLGRLARSSFPPVRAATISDKPFLCTQVHSRQEAT